MAPTRHGPGPGRAPRRGFALPLIIVMSLIIGGMLYAVNRVVTGYRHQSTRFRDGEVAYYAARAVLEIAEARLEEVLRGPPPREGRDRALYRFLVRTPTADLANAEDSLELPYLERVLPPGTDGEAGVTIRMVDLKPLGIDLPPGFKPDPLEKRGTLQIEAWARVRAATRRLRVRRPMRVLYRLPPLAGRFSLLFGRPGFGPESANALTYAPRLGVFQTSSSASLGWPLTVYPLPVAQDEQTPMRRFEDDPLAPMRNGGWIALLGRTPWILNTTFGPGDASPLEEGRNLRSFDAVFPSPSISGAYEKARRLGFARNILELPMFRDLEDPTLRDTASILHLAGDARSPLPPLVLGRVFRRYLEFSKLARDDDGPFTSFHGVPATAYDEVRAEFETAAGGADFSQYQAVMARPVVEPYNRTYDFVVTDDQTRDSGGRVVPGDTPWSPARHLRASATEPWIRPVSGLPEDFLYPSAADLDTDKGAGAVAIGEEGGADLFSGSPEEILEGIGELAEARAVWRLEGDASRGPAELFRDHFLQGNELRLGTSAHVKASSFSVSGWKVVHGGTVVVDGDVYVSGPITAAPGEVLAIVSRNGKIVVTNEEPVNALLVAPRGPVVPSGDGLDLRGALLAAEFDPLPWMARKGASRVVYDTRLNPASTQARLAQFRIHLGDERQLVLERR